MPAWMNLPAIKTSVLVFLLWVYASAAVPAAIQTTPVKVHDPRLEISLFARDPDIVTPTPFM